MNTSPSIDDLLEGVIKVLGEEVLPSVADPKPQASTAMAMSLLQSVRQLLPVYDGYLVEEHNAMIEVLHNTAAALGDADPDTAQRIAARARNREPFPAPVDREAVMEGHRALTLALADTMRDLDELQRADIAEAHAALDVVRAHLGPRYLRDAATIVVEGGMVGRG